MHTGYRGLRRVGATVSLATFMVGCASSTIFLEGRRHFPAEPHFTVLPREYEAKELAAAGVRTDGAYVSIGFRPQPDGDRRFARRSQSETSSSQYYYRFWPNGRVIGRPSRTQPLTPADADSFDDGWLGYYKPGSQGEIIAEIYSWQGGRGYYDYNQIVFAIEGGTLWVDYGNNYRRKGQLVQIGYRFVPIVGLRAQPDW
jgi:hypothetical protein